MCMAVVVAPIPPLSVSMDDYMFRQHIEDCQTVEEKTTYLEIFNYSVRPISLRTVGISSQAPGFLGGQTLISMWY